MVQWPPPQDNKYIEEVIVVIITTWNYVEIVYI